MTDSSRGDDAGALGALLDKVRKLLAMAEGTTNANEADAFSRKAAELIAEHRLDPDRLAAAGDDELTVHEYPMGRGAYVRARIALLQSVAEAHGCRVVFHAGYAGTTAYVAGFRDDLATTELLYTSLHAQASSRMAREQRSTGAATQRWRRSFLFGFADEVRRMLDTSHRRAEAGHAAAPGAASASPALRAREQLVDEHLERRFGRIAAARPVASPTPTGFVAGRYAAARADIGRDSVRAQRAIGRGGAP